jgi:hypothetical protein
VLQAINIYDHGRTGEPQDWSEWSVRGIANERSIKPPRHGMQSRKKCMNDGIEVLMPDRWQDFQSDAMEFELSR